MNPNYDILGLEAGASSDAISKAFRRLELVFERDEATGSPEFGDIEAAFKELPESGEEIDRKVWEWVTWTDKEGEWNTLVRKSHRLAKKAEAVATWSKDKARDTKKGKDRKGGRDKRAGGGYSED